MAAPKKVDWERIEPAWRRGVKSVPQLAAEYEADTGKKVSLTAINKHFKRLGVPRDLAAKVQAKAAAMVSAAMVSGKVSGDAETTPSDVAMINAGAVEVATVLLRHREDLVRLYKARDKLIAELDGEPTKLFVTAYLGKVITMDIALTVSEKASTLQSLTSITDRIITLERQAYGVKSEDAEAEDSYESLLRRLHEATA